ncbi:MAG: hypothetical protein LBC82_06075 [Oscillospiraceae bacterium]|nr:hypothetical protein [Oscillospiraceae bacterium]
MEVITKLQNNNDLFVFLNEKQKQIILKCEEFLYHLWDGDTLIRQYTDHGRDHSIRVLDKILELPGFLKNNNCILSQKELYLLILSVLFHDIGMQCDFKMYPSVKQNCEKKHNIIFESNFQSDLELTPTNMKELRKHHHFITATFLLEAYKNLKDSSLHHAIREIEADELNIVCTICQYHSKLNIEDCMDFPKTGERVRVRLLAAILRLGDELDIDGKRVRKDAIFEFYHKDENKLYWYLHSQTKVVMADNKILINILLSEDDYSQYKENFTEYLRKLFQKNEVLLRILRDNGLLIDFGNVQNCICSISECDDIPTNILSHLFPAKFPELELDELGEIKNTNAKNYLSEDELIDILRKNELDMFLICNPFPDHLANKNFSKTITDDLFFARFHVVSILTYKRICSICKVLKSQNKNSIFFTGFRGSGKTTFANFIRQIAENKRVIPRISKDEFFKRYNSHLKADELYYTEFVNETIREFEEYFNDVDKLTLSKVGKHDYFNRCIDELNSDLTGMCFYLNFETNMNLDSPRPIENKLIHVIRNIMRKTISNTEPYNYDYTYNKIISINDILNSNVEFNINDVAKKFMNFCVSKFKANNGIFDELLCSHLDDYNTQNLLIIILLLDIIKMSNREDIDKIIYIFDNMDAIDNPTTTKMFIDNYHVFITDMEKIMSVIAQHDDFSDFNFHENYCCIFFLRDTTANVTCDHFKGIFNFFSDNHDISTDIDKSVVLNKKCDYVLSTIDSFKIIPRTERSIKFIKNIIDDPYANYNLVGIFNNDYIRFVKCLCEVCSNPDNKDILMEYTDILEKIEKDSFPFDILDSIKYGARGIIYRLIFDSFKNNKHYGTYGYFGKLGLTFGDSVSENYSKFRLILFYLFKHMPKHFGKLEGNSEGMVLFSQLVSKFEKVFGESREKTIELITDALWGMYDLKNSETWGHLITFDSLQLEEGELVSKKAILDTANNCLNENTKGKPKNHKIAITCAGRAYVNLICSHFEFFSMRFLNSSKPLFCEANLLPSDLNSATFKFEELLNSVYESFEDGLQKLSKIEDIMFSRMGLEKEQIHESEIIYHFPGEKNSSMFHLERALHRIITYISSYRTWLIKCKAKNDFNQAKIYNQKITPILKKYVSLLKTPHFSYHNSRWLYNDYISAITSVENSNYNDCFIFGAKQFEKRRLTYKK